MNTSFSCLDINWSTDLQHVCVPRKPLASALFIGYFLIPVVIVGTVLNMLSMLVFGLNSKSTARYYLISISAWDNFLLISSFCLHSVPYLSYGRLQVVPAILAQSYRYSYAISNISLVGSLWTAIALTHSRSQVISNPFQHQHVSRKSRHNRNKLKTLLFSLFSFVQGIPLFLEAKVSSCRYIMIEQSCSIPQELLFQVLPSEMRGNTLYAIIYRVLAASLFQYIGPFLVLFGLLGHTCYILLKAKRFREQFTPSKSDNNDSTMLICLALKFLLCFSLIATLNALELIMGDIAFNNLPTMTHIINIMNGIVNLNAATNFFVYFFVGKTFGSKIKAMLLRCQYRSPRGENGLRQEPSGSRYPSTTNLPMLSTNGRAASTRQLTQLNGAQAFEEVVVIKYHRNDQTTGNQPGLHGYVMLCRKSSV